MFLIILTFVGILIGAVGFYFLSTYVLIKQPPIVLNILKVVFVVLILLVAFMNYNSIDSKMVLTKNVETRNKAVQERLTRISEAQVEYKKVRGQYADSFENLLDFLNNDSIPQIFMEGEVPDTLIGREAEALAMGIITRDTTQTPVRNVLFKENFESIVDSIAYVPYTNGIQFVIDAGSIDRNKMKVNVFIATAYLKDIYVGLETDNEGYDMNDSLYVCNMEEPTTNGNWKD